MTHHCPKCGGFSWHGPGSHHWALECPFCHHVAKQHPHEPGADAPSPIVDDQDDDVEAIVAEIEGDPIADTYPDDDDDDDEVELGDEDE